MDLAKDEIMGVSGCQSSTGSTAVEGSRSDDWWTCSCRVSGFDPKGCFGVKGKMRVVGRSCQFVVEDVLLGSLDGLSRDDGWFQS